MHVFINILLISFRRFLYSTTREMYLFVPLSLYGTGETVHTSQLTAQLSRYYILVKAMHRECFQASSKLEIWPRLISTWRQNGALLRDRFRLRDSKARLSAIKSSRLADRRSSRPAFPFSLSTVRVGKARIILALCEEDACWGYFALVRPSEPAVVLRRSV